MDKLKNDGKLLSVMGMGLYPKTPRGSRPRPRRGLRSRQFAAYPARPLAAILHSRVLPNYYLCAVLSNAHVRKVLFGGLATLGKSGHFYFYSFRRCPLIQ